MTHARNNFQAVPTVAVVHEPENEDRISNDAQLKKKHSKGASEEKCSV